MTTSRKHPTNHSASRSLAALVGAVPPALGIGVALALLLPLAQTESYLVGYYSVFPIWTTICLFTFRASSGRGAWLATASLTALAVVLVFLARALQRA